MSPPLSLSPQPGDSRGGGGSGLTFSSGTLPSVRDREGGSQASPTASSSLLSAFLSASSPSQHSEHLLSHPPQRARVSKDPDSSHTRPTTRVLLQVCLSVFFSFLPVHRARDLISSHPIFPVRQIPAQTSPPPGSPPSALILHRVCSDLPQHGVRLLQGRQAHPSGAGMLGLLVNLTGLLRHPAVLGKAMWGLWGAEEGNWIDPSPQISDPYCIVGDALGRGR